VLSCRRAQSNLTERQRDGPVSQMMRIIDTQIDIAASASLVWQLLTDFPKYADWNPFITGIEGRPEMGARLRVRICPPGRSAITFTPTILAATREWELRWRSRRIVPGFFDSEHSFQIRTHGLFCRFHQSERFTGIMVTLVGDDVFDAMQQGFEQMNAALKLRAEAISKQQLMPHRRLLDLNTEFEEAVEQRGLPIQTRLA
jgi:hypothetical protein